jgi:hypothetical protein
LSSTYLSVLNILSQNILCSHLEHLPVHICSMNFATIQLLYQVPLDPFGHIIIRLPFGSCIVSLSHPTRPADIAFSAVCQHTLGCTSFLFSCSTDLCLILFVPLLGTRTIKSPTGLVLTAPLSYITIMMMMMMISIIILLLLLLLLPTSSNYSSSVSSQNSACRTAPNSTCRTAPNSTCRTAPNSTCRTAPNSTCRTAPNSTCHSAPNSTCRSAPNSTRHIAPHSTFRTAPNSTYRTAEQGED